MSFLTSKSRCMQKNQLCRCPTYHTKRVVLIRSLRRRPYRMKPTAVGFISLTTVMALAHPLHPTDNRSRNRRRNLWVGWCVSSWWPLFPSRSSVFIYIYIYIYVLLYEFCFLWFTNCVLLSDDNSLIPGCLWLLAFVLNNTLILGIWCSTIPHLPGCFCPWTFFFKISDSTWCYRTPLCHI